MEDVPEPAEVGVAVALEKICTLESRLRQAIQSTHTLHRSFGRDMGAVDREREALLLIRYNSFLSSTREVQDIICGASRGSLRQVLCEP